jgi:hypothetical protein
MLHSAAQSDHPLHVDRPAGFFRPRVASAAIAREQVARVLVIGVQHEPLRVVRRGRHQDQPLGAATGRDAAYGSFT